MKYVFKSNARGWGRANKDYLAQSAGAVDRSVRQTIDERPPAKCPTIRGTARARMWDQREQMWQRVTVEVCPDQASAMRSSPSRQPMRRSNRRHGQPPIDFRCNVPQ